MNTFKKRLQAYRTEVEKLAAEAGYKPELRKRGRNSNDLLMHYEWLALRVCKRLTNEEIGRLYSPPRGRRLTEAAVRDAVKRTAKSIGLPDRTEDKRTPFLTSRQQRSTCLNLRA